MKAELLPISASDRHNKAWEMCDDTSFTAIICLPSIGLWFTSPVRPCAHQQITVSLCINRRHAVIYLSFCIKINIMDALPGGSLHHLNGGHLAYLLCLITEPCACMVESISHLVTWRGALNQCSLDREAGEGVCNNGLLGQVAARRIVLLSKRTPPHQAHCHYAPPEWFAWKRENVPLAIVTLTI